MRKIVLDQFGCAWGYVDVEKSIREVAVFSVKASNGCPVNVRTRKVSSAQKYEKQLQQTEGYAVFARYEYGDQTFYRY